MSNGAAQKLAQKVEQPMDLQKLAEVLGTQSGNPVCAGVLAQFEAGCRRLIETFEGLGKDWEKATLSVTLPDGRWFVGDNAAEVFADAIEAIGPARVAGLGIACSYRPLAVNIAGTIEHYNDLKDGWKVCVLSSTPRKVELLKQIGIELELVGMKVFGVVRNAQRSSSGFEIARVKNLFSSSVVAI